jgi:superfamily II DNA or RNA helicase
MTFKKGRDYAEGRRVSLMALGGNSLKAKVLGSDAKRYDVEMKPGAPGVLSQCNCESWGKYGPHCKHVVAVALVYLTRLRANGNAALPPLPSAPEAQAPAASAMAVGPSNENAALPALAKLENWLGLSALPDIEFHYRLAPATGGHARHWVMDVRRIDAPAQGPVQVKRMLSAGTRIAPADERVFLELGRFEVRYDSRIVLSDEDLSNLLPFLKARRVIYRGTPMMFEEQPVRPVIRLENKTDGAYARIDLQLPDGSTLSLKEAIVLAGRHTHVLVAQRLYTLDPDFPPRMLRKWLLEPTMVFPPSQLDRILSFFAAHLPRFRMGLKAEGLEVEEGVEPKFVLTVEGAPDKVTARLAAKYGEWVTVAVSPTAQHLGYAAGGPATERKLYLRQETHERAAGQGLVDQGFRFDSTAQTYVAANDAALEFWSKGIKVLPPEWETFAAAPPKIRVRPKVRPRVRVNMSGVNWFELEADFVSEDQSLDLGAVRLWLNSGRRYIPLNDGSFAEADLNELKAAADLLEEAGALPGKKTTKLPLFHGPAIDMLSSLGEVEIDAKARKALAELKEIDGIPPVKAPAALQGTLRHYQEAGLAWLWFLYRHGLSGVLADDMGLGKTVQALTLLLKVRQEEGSKPVLVVAPTSVLVNWEREIERFAPELTRVTWHGSDRKENAEKLGSVDVVLTSYALVRRDLAELKKVAFRCIVLDEAQNIKNSDSATAQACKSLPADTRLALTGTPLENRLTELWSLFDFLMPGFLGTADTFHDRFEHPIMVQADMSVRDRLKRRIHPFILRRLKTEVAKDLPPKTEMVAYCEMEDVQAALYREVLEESRRKVYDTIEKVGFNRSRVSILTALMRMRQVCCDPRLLKMPGGTINAPSAKLERFGELVDDLIAEGHRALVFSQFTEMLELLKNQSDEKKIKYMYLDGRTKDRMSKVDQFNAPDGPPIFFISLKAGGTGLNLTAADYVIHYDPWWNPAVEDQATDRTHRIGQTRAVFSYKLITKGTVEEKILALQKRKRELAAGLLGTDEEVGKLLTEADVAELFRPE